MLQNMLKGVIFEIEEIVIVGIVIAIVSIIVECENEPWRGRRGLEGFCGGLWREDGDLDAITPPLDGTILPGVTRDSALKLLAAHPEHSILPGLSPSQKVHPKEARITLTDIFRYADEGRLVEAFGIGTAPLILPINRIGFEGKDVHLPAYHTGTSPVADALYDRIFDIQTGQFDWEGWSIICE